MAINKVDFKKKLKEKKDSLRNLNKEDIKNFFKKFREDKKNIFLVLVFILVLVLFSVVWYSFVLFTTLNELNEKTDNLKKISTYDIDGNNLTDDIISISEIENKVEKIEKEKSSIEETFSRLQAPFDDFLKHFYLPSLNIWKNPYTKELDLDLVGKRFLESNRYVDTNLLKTWSDFFRDAGKSLDYNEITDIKIGDIQKKDGNYFNIPVNVSFRAPSRASFLVLVNKLSLTSNKKNVLLLNEFLYQIWEEIKNYNKTSELISEMKSEEDFLTGKNDNFVIGYVFYERIKNDKKNILLEGEKGEKIIENAIKNIENCDSINNDCYFNFRDTFSSIPYIAYKIGASRIQNKTNNLKSFLQNMPPLLNVESFSFRRLEGDVKGQGDVDNQGYVGDIKINVYGESLSNKERIEIASKFGEECLESSKNIVPQNVLPVIRENIRYSRGEDMDSSKIRDYLELEEIVSSMKEKFEDLNNYKKTLKQFELYRMLKANSLCDK